MAVLTDLIIRFDETGNNGYLHERLTVAVPDAGDLIVVPKGFKTDFASIPGAVRSLIPQLGRWTHGAVVHDYLYWVGPSMGYTQKMADDIFLSLMKEAGVKLWRRQAIHKALRLGGWTAWNGHRKANHTFRNAIRS